jgi:nucleoside-diphosphate-sugar epimerase
MADRKVLLTGATGRVAGPVAQALAASNEVWCLGRFRDPDVRSRLEAIGLKTVPWDMEASSFSDLPDDFTHVMHAAVVREDDDYDKALEDNCRAAAALMLHCRKATAFLYVSSSAVYKPIEPGHLHREHDPLGGIANTQWAPSYGIAKTACEGTVRALSSTLGVPVAIARLSVAYGSASGSGDHQGGLPVQLFRRMSEGSPVWVRPNNESWCNPLHSEDIVRLVPRLWDVASVPATIVNWGGDHAVSLSELMDYVSGLTGVPVLYQESESAAGIVAVDPQFRQSLVGRCEITWQEGVRRSLVDYFPGALVS